ncbi:MAG: stage 0 sporulation family protein [Desulfobacterales bacterium]|nr:stage 0 sporulation family protein [Desulfobacterales bacterium]
MNKIVGIKFKNESKVYDFDSGHFVLKKNDKVMVRTSDGLVVGNVCTEPQNRKPNVPKRALKKIFRLATEAEIERYESGSSIEDQVYSYCFEKIKEKSMPMSLISVEKKIDGSKIVVYFAADSRVDFRELVKTLAKRFRVRIEMRQVGVRHQAKMIGGLGPCGRSLCCSVFLDNFAPVTIKMAKEQNISLNPGKISGMCGRLMCCLAYEHKHYEKAKRNLPKIGKKINTKSGEGKVIRQNILKQTVSVQLESEEIVEVAAKDIVRDRLFKKKKRPHAKKGVKAHAKM